MASQHPNKLNGFFTPRSIAVVGVSPDSDKLGSIIFHNLQENGKSGNLKARVYAVNPKYQSIGSLRCYASLRALPEVPDLVVIATPAAASLPIVDEASECGVLAAVMIPGGFSETGRRDLQDSILLRARKSGMRILGPNTIGLLDTSSGVDTLFLKTAKSFPDGSSMVSHLKALRGGVVVITQSGHLGEAISEELAAKGVGIRALVGTGNQLDVSVEEVIERFADDPSAKVIAVYVEGVSDGRRFIRAAARASRKKPVVAFKVGKTATGARAALTHTASLVGDYAAYRAAFRKSGVIEAESLQEMVDYCLSLSTLPRVGRNLVIITNAGGVGAIAADEAVSIGLAVPPPKEPSARRLHKVMGGAVFMPNSSLANPMDLTASASTEDFAKFSRAVLELPDYDLALILPTHQAPAIGWDLATKLSDAVSNLGKPVAMAVIGWSPFADSIRRQLQQRGIPWFPTPERAIRALGVIVQPAHPAKSGYVPDASKRDRVTQLSGSGGLIHPESVTRLLSKYHIQQPKSVIVRTDRDLTGALELDFPVACKLVSEQLVHKSDSGAVILGVGSDGSLASAFKRLVSLSRRKHLPFRGMLVQEMAGGTETLVGGTRDPTFGPMVVFGSGGRYAEVLRDVCTAIAPVSPREAEEMVRQTRVAGVLKGIRGGRKANIKKLATVISSFSRIMVENHSVAEMEINPLMVDGDRIQAVDTRVLVSTPKAKGGPTYSK